MILVQSSEPIAVHVFVCLFVCFWIMQFYHLYFIFCFDIFFTKQYASINKKKGGDGISESGHDGRLLLQLQQKIKIKKCFHRL